MTTLGMIEKYLRRDDKISLCESTFVSVCATTVYRAFYNHKHLGSDSVTVFTACEKQIEGAFDMCILFRDFSFEQKAYIQHKTLALIARLLGLDFLSIIHREFYIKYMRKIRFSA